jgi:hypothetical protein
MDISLFFLILPLSLIAVVGVYKFSNRKHFQHVEELKQEEPVVEVVAKEDSTRVVNLVL